MYGQSVGSLRAYIAPLNVPLSEVIVNDDQEYARSYLVFEQAGSKSNEWHEEIVRIAKVTSEFQVSVHDFHNYTCALLLTPPDHIRGNLRSNSTQ